MDLREGVNEIVSMSFKAGTHFLKSNHLNFFESND